MKPAIMIALFVVAFAVTADARPWRQNRPFSEATITVETTPAPVVVKIKKIEVKKEVAVKEVKKVEAAKEVKEVKKVQVVVKPQETMKKVEVTKKVETTCKDGSCSVTKTYQKKRTRK